MIQSGRWTSWMAILVFLGPAACVGNEESSEPDPVPATQMAETEDAEGSEGEHAAGEGSEGVGESEGEEGGEYIARSEMWDMTRRGVRLKLSFDAARNAFTGTVENTTDSEICAVRIEVHLASGSELGPTERRDLDAGQSATVSLATGGEQFERWTAHPEMSACGS